MIQRTLTIKNGDVHWPRYSRTVSVGWMTGQQSRVLRTKRNCRLLLRYWGYRRRDDREWWQVVAISDDLVFINNGLVRVGICAAAWDRLDLPWTLDDAWISWERIE